MSTLAALFPSLLGFYLAGLLHYLAAAVNDEETRGHVRDDPRVSVPLIVAVLLLWPLAAAAGFVLLAVAHRASRSAHRPL